MVARARSSSAMQPDGHPPGPPTEPAVGTPERRAADPLAAERAFREIALELASLRDPEDVVRRVVLAAGRLVEADGAIVSRYDPADSLLHWGVDDGVRDGFEAEYVRDLTLEIGVGLTGEAVAERRVLMCNDHLMDAFPRSPESDHFFEVTGFRAMIAAPIVAESTLFGALEVYSRREHAFDERDAELLEAFAAQAAAALANARLVADLAASRAELAHRAEAERSLREISSRISSARDPGAVVERTIDEATRLLAGDAARVDLLDPSLGLLRGVYSSDEAQPTLEEWPDTPDERLDQGIAGQAYTRSETLWTGDYLADASFPHASGSDTYVAGKGIRSVIAAPLPGEHGPIGTLTVMTRRGDAFGPAEAALLEAFAAQVAISLGTARLIEDLDRSQSALQRAADRERSLRETGARLLEVEDVDTVLHRIVTEAHRLLGADGARIDLLDQRTLHLHWTYAAGDTAEADARLLREEGLPLGRGVAGKAAAEGRAILTGDVMNDPAIDRPPASTQFIEETGIRSVLSAPLPGSELPLGTLSVLSRQLDAFDQDDVGLLVTFALQAAIAITNARRMDALRQATEENARRADRERILREIAGRIAELREASGIVQLAVDASARLLDADGARLDMGTGGQGEALRRRLGEIVSDDRFRLGPRPRDEEAIGVSGEAIRRGRAFWTDDYVGDPAFARSPGQVADAQRLGIRSVMSAPITGEEGSLGALTVLSRRTAAFDEADGTTLEALASLVGAALRTAELLQRVRDSEARYRFRLGASPDMAWEADADGITRFVSAASRTIFGREPEDMVGRHFGEHITPSTADAAASGWARLIADPGVVQSSHFSIRHADGSEVPLENFAVGLVDASGRFTGAHGSVRDLRERQRLERELVESQQRYRMLVEYSPDIVWQTDAEGAFVYVSESVESQLGWRPDELVGRSFTAIVDEESLPEALERVGALRTDPSRTEHIMLRLVHRDGRRIPFDIRGSGLVREGTFVGIHGSSRDVSERMRLEQEARESEARFRELVQTSPDGVWQTDPAGALVFWSDAAISLLGWDPEALLGRHWTTVVAPSAHADVRASLKPLEEAPPGTVARVRALALRSDGTGIPTEISGVPLLRDGRFAGIQGTIRDLRPQVRLERELREQAGALASAEERAHLARELHDSVTQALFSMGLLTRSIEVLVERDTASAVLKLADLRALQREALAEMRSLVFELRPGSLQQDGLANALRTHVAAVEARLGLPVIVEVDDVERLPLAVEDALYRIAQEALHNVVKHAEASDVRIELGREGDDVVLRVTDDGAGFDPGTVSEGHLGLAGMASRAARAGCRLTVRSIRGRGTTIEVIVPPEAQVVADPEVEPSIDGVDGAAAETRREPPGGSPR